MQQQWLDSLSTIDRYRVELSVPLQGAQGYVQAQFASLAKSQPSAPAAPASGVHVYFRAAASWVTVRCPDEFSFRTPASAAGESKGGAAKSGATTSAPKSKIAPTPRYASHDATLGTQSTFFLGSSV